MIFCRLIKQRISVQQLLQQHKRFFATTYYDSQSGMHVSIHNQDEISVFAFVTNTSELDSIQKAGMNGAILHANDIIIPKVMDTFEIFTRFLPPYPSPQWNLVVDYNDESIKGENVLDRLHSCGADGIKTTISLMDSSNYVKDPIEVANGVAHLIDATRGGDFVLIGGHSHVDDVVALCEELVYLDVPGPTIKSRLIVDLSHSDDSKDQLMEETMRIGVNKFVIQENWFERFKDSVDELGKRMR